MSSDLVQRLRDRIDELEGLLGTSVDASRRYHVLGMGPTTRRALGYIVKRQIATREGLYAALHGSRPENEQPDIKVLDQQIWRIRNALEPHGITIKTEWGVGYSMDAKNKAKLEALLPTLERGPKRKRMGI